MEDIKVRLGDCIKTKREALGITQRDLGKAIGKDPMTIFRIEKGDNWPQYETLCALASALKETPESLLSLALAPRTPTPEECLEVLAKAISKPVPKVEKEVANKDVIPDELKELMSNRDVLNALTSLAKVPTKDLPEVLDRLNLATRSILDFDGLVNELPGLDTGRNSKTG